MSIEKHKTYIAALFDMQDKLGWPNDVAVGELLTEMQSEQTDLTGVAGYIRGYLAARDEKKVREALEKV